MNSIEANGIHLGLENTRQILNHFSYFFKDFEIDSSSRKIRFIQVAGTNGKSSTANMLTSILQGAGYNVGLFTSPHLEDIRETITINKQWISAEDFVNSFNAIKKLSDNLLQKRNIKRMPTFFETLFLVAIHYFYENKLDIIVLEVGLGGRLDATSTIDADVSVITNIARDHTSILGPHLKDIAVEKGGIIRTCVPVVCGCKTGSSTHRVLKSIAAAKQAPFFNVIDSKNRLEVNCNSSSYSCTYSGTAGDYSFEVRLNGRHQPFNAAVAVKTLEVLNRTSGPIKVSPDSIAQGIANTFMPARIEMVDTFPQVILDTSHNVNSISALTQFLKEKKLKNLTLVFGVLADKNYRKMISLLLPFIHRVILTQPLSHRALPPHKMLKFFKNNGVQIRPDIEEAYRAAQQYKRDILITGSFYLVGVVRKRILAGGQRWI